MKFDHFQKLMAQVWQFDETGVLQEKYEQIEPQSLPPLVLAYVGDAYFSLYLRCRMLKFEQKQVRILHTLDAKMVSAVMQAKAYHALAEKLTEEEKEIVRRGRNAKSNVPKSASVAEYRTSTGFEALMGYLYLMGEKSRLTELAEAAFDTISREMAGNLQQSAKGGEK